MRQLLDKVSLSWGNMADMSQLVWRESHTYDKDGNLLTETGTRKEARYAYNGTNRMVLSQVTDVIAHTRVTTVYAYDAYGRRTVRQDRDSNALRTLYDGFSFEVIREGVTFQSSGSFTTNPPLKE